MGVVLELQVCGLCRLAHDEAETVAYEIVTHLRDRASERLSEMERACLSGADAGGEPEVDCERFHEDVIGLVFAGHYPAAAYFGPHWLRLALAVSRHELEGYLSARGLALAAPLDDARELARSSSHPLVVLADGVYAVDAEHDVIVGGEVIAIATRPPRELAMLRAIGSRCACSMCAALREHRE
jgi:hypothetical protein